MDSEAHRIGNEARALPNDFRIGEPRRQDGHLRERRGLLFREKVAALTLHLLSHLTLDSAIADQRLLGTAQGSVVVTLARNDVAHRFGNVGGGLDICGNVSRTDAECGFSRALSCAHEPHPARCQDHGGTAMAHQLLRCLQRDLAQAGHEPFRSPGRDGSAFHDLGRP